VDDPLLPALRDVVGTAHLLVDPDLRAPHEVDWTGRFRGSARAVVRPASTEQVAAVLRACAEHTATVVVQGGNTGLVGGGVPRPAPDADDAHHGVGRDVVLLTTRLDRLDDVDEASGSVAVGAGATLAAVRAHVAPHGLDVGVDLASRDSATIGGMVATDAGGTRVVAHGPMHDQVLGLEAVLADGRVLTSWLDAAVKDTAGYALPRLLVGSEGTLAVVTRVRLRLRRPPTDRVVAVLGCRDVAAAVGLLAPVRRAAGTALQACELVLRAGIDLVVGTTGATDPVPGAGVALLLELAGDDGPEPLLARLAALDGPPGLEAIVVGADEGDRRRLWAVRERHTEAVATLGVPHKLDVAVPLVRLAELLERVGPAVAAVAPDATVHLWGHAAEGNVHVNVVGPAADDDAADDAVLALVGRLGGTISAEHGVGRAKVDHLHHTRDAASIAVMRAVKQALDPDGRLGPGVLLADSP